MDEQQHHQQRQQSPRLEREEDEPKRTPKPRHKPLLSSSFTSSSFFDRLVLSGNFHQQPGRCQDEEETSPAAAADDPRHDDSAGDVIHDASHRRRRETTALDATMSRSVENWHSALERRRRRERERHRHGRRESQHQQQLGPQHAHDETADLCDFAVTPMTSRPHNCCFYNTTSSPPTNQKAFIRRVRSRSLGHYTDATGVDDDELPTRRQPPPSSLPRRQPPVVRHSIGVVSADDYNHATAVAMMRKNDNFIGGDDVLAAVAELQNQLSENGELLPIETDDYYGRPAEPTTTSAADDAVPPSGGGIVEEKSTTTSSSSSSPKMSSSAASTPPPPHPIRICILYGMINATIVLPVLMSFATIIYRDDAFRPYMGQLTTLTIVSGIVHQLCFSTFSTLPFAVGQVQDAGLIFLSGMASTLVRYCHEQSHDDATMMATVTVGLSLATAVLGLGLVGVGRLQLAQRVQLLPNCVVGGYLVSCMAAAFIGWFCGIAGLGLMAGSSSKITLLRGVQEQWHLVLPGLIVGLVMYSVVRQIRHVATLPIFIAVEIVIFYAILYLTGTSVADATEAGWIRQSMVDDNAPRPSWTHTWDYLRFDLVDWRAYPQLAMTEIGMIFVVALSSSLDVAAIELELKHQPLDYNHELQTVGWSNIVSGLTGGYTGSYIFSQSIFSLRAGIRSRVAGFALAGCQILVVLAPFPILAYVPNFFFGSLLSMICIDLMYEWLWDVRTRLSKTEYLVCLATFILIQLLSVEYGILAGVALHQVCQRLGWLPTMMMMMRHKNGNNNVKRSQYDINDFEPDHDDELYHQEEHAHLLPDHENNLPRYDSLATSVDTNDDLYLF